MSSRRLDISSLLCDVPDPVILAPHLRKQPAPGNLPYLGLDALVHVASQERSRLSNSDDKHWHTVLDHSPHTPDESTWSRNLRCSDEYQPSAGPRRLSGPGVPAVDHFVRPEPRILHDQRLLEPSPSSAVVPSPIPSATSEVVRSLAKTEPATEDVQIPDVVQVDVQNELLVVDDRPPVKAPPPPDPSLPIPSPSSFVFPSSPQIVLALTPERGSMPPPASTTSTRGEITLPKKGERAGSVTAPRKKKDTISKAPAKPKQPAKPRNKTGPKTKLQIIPDVTSASTAKSAKPSNGPAKKSAPGTSRSRSTSAMPGGSVGPEGDVRVDNEGEGQADDDEDDKLYCVCRTRYDEDKVMIACDRCDGWYHTQCVNMPDLEVDLVDQFICPLCVGKNPNLPLKTTYKRRCLVGLKHHDPSSPEACHKPARGAFSKYCSDDCGVSYMQANIKTWTENGGNKERLWESVKGAEKREGVVISVDPPKDAIADATPKRGKVEREVQRLSTQLDEVVRIREGLKKDLEVVLWRKRLLELAAERAENVDQCGWDQRLCFGDEEWADFGSGVLESYEVADDAIEVDGVADGEGAWWCAGKKKCERHTGWQALRAKDVAHETEKTEESLLKLTTQEREIRKRMEDIVDHGRNSNESPTNALMEASNTKPRNGNHTMDMNGDQEQKGKKRKASQV